MTRVIEVIGYIGVLWRSPTSWSGELRAGYRTVCCNAILRPAGHFRTNLLLSAIPGEDRHGEKNEGSQKNGRNAKGDRQVAARNAVMATRRLTATEIAETYSRASQSAYSGLAADDAAKASNHRGDHTTMRPIVRGPPDSHGSRHWSLS